MQGLPNCLKMASLHKTSSGVANPATHSYAHVGKGLPTYVAMALPADWTEGRQPFAADGLGGSG